MRNILICCLFAMGSSLSAPAIACCAYNHTSDKMNVEIWKKHQITPWDYITLHVSPGDHACTDGVGGAAAVKKVVDNGFDIDLCTVGVDDHGWVSIYKETNRYKVVSKHSDGAVSATCYSD